MASSRVLSNIWDMIEIFRSDKMYHHEPVYAYYTMYIWVFPKIGVPPNHPFY